MTAKKIKGKKLEENELPKDFNANVMAVHKRIVEEEESARRNKLHEGKKEVEEMHKPDCLFCQMARGEKQITIFAKFPLCYAIKDQFPVSPGHVLIIPYDHTENWFTASEDVRSDMMKALSLVKEKLDSEYAPQGYNIGANCGEAAGQTVMHLHLHLIPRYKADMADPKGGVRGVIPSKQKY